MESGYFALVLHAHLPYIRHEDRDDYLEERWLHEAITETYLPLLDVFERLAADGISYRITLTLTPTLCNMLHDPLLQNRYVAYLNRLIELSSHEINRTVENPHLNELAIMYQKHFQKLLAQFESYDRCLLPRFSALQDQGLLEIITCGATHGFLPLMKTEEAIRGQIAIGVSEYRKFFGRNPKGIWLPECGYTLGVDRILREFGLAYFLVDTHSILHATPKPSRGVYAPLQTPYGIAAFARDPESSKQVWSSIEGYPGDPDYREYYRDIGWDLGWDSKEDWEYIKPYLLSNGDRIHTGIKYYRITGDPENKEPYEPEIARQKAADHAAHFVWNRQKQVENEAAHLDRKPLIVSTYDAELFGHWWYEGPIWIEMLARQFYHNQEQVRMVTPSEYLAEYPVQEVGQLPTSSWGRAGYADVWLNETNQWIYRHLHQAEERLIEAVTDEKSKENESNVAEVELSKRILKSSVKELLLAQSSDWAFIMDAKTVVDYAVKRTKEHLGKFHELLRTWSELHHGSLSKKQVEELEARIELYEKQSPCFETVDMSWYEAVNHFKAIEPIQEKSRVLMLSWEYPPKIVGGLARAVFDLSNALVKQGLEVHVVTSEMPGSPFFEIMEGVHVHRIPVLTSPDFISFVEWVFQMNVSMVDHVLEMHKRGTQFQYIHAHDWLVATSARELKHSLQLPLIATIHATEYGRNHGRIQSEMQQKIHHLEWELTFEAQRVIACSQHMQREIQEVFDLPEEKIDMRPNGVARLDEILPFIGEERNAYAHESEKIIFYVGRLVYEKGVQTLISAMPEILSKCPEAKLVIAGRGPMMEELRAQAAHLGDKVLFAGFVDDDTRDRLYRTASVTVFPSHYEPFGIVALEAMRCLSPLVVSDTGGMSEIIDHGVDGYKAIPGHPESLAYQIVQILQHPDFAAQMAERAYLKVQNSYNWEQIAQDTQLTYEICRK